ncbi:MAG: hypothetical protein IT372_39280, partial [Polyangiaceae bacterium]|nr:hypothetical protein [Polyangiaceae bacterium]
MALAASPTALALALTAVALSTEIFALLPFAILLSTLGAVTTLHAWSRNPDALEREGAVRADAAGVSFAGAPLVGREALREAFVLPRAGKPPVVRLVRRGRRAPIDVRVRDEAEGRRMLRALGLDASQAVASFALPSRVVMSRRLRLAVFGGAGALAALAPIAGWLIAPEVPEVWAVLMMAPLVAALVFSRMSQTTLRVGADGLLITWLGARRFIRHADVIDVTAYEDAGPARHRWAGVEVWLESGERLRLPIAPKRALTGPSGEIGEERIRAAMDPHRRGDATGDAALLRRRGREVGGWLR